MFVNEDNYAQWKREFTSNRSRSMSAFIRQKLVSQRHYEPVDKLNLRMLIIWVYVGQR